MELTPLIDCPPPWPPGGPEEVIELEPVDATAPGEARQAVAERLGDSLTADDCADTLLLVSELVTNAVRHADCPDDAAVHIRLAVGDRSACIEVCDRGSGFTPAPTAPHRPQGGGLGLLLVERIAKSWGVRTAHGACVWFELPR
jgi:anti-sigma regulatory factor (Ser/Thr protein kinase)